MEQLSGKVGENAGSKGAGWQLILLLGALTAVGPLSVDMYLPAFPQMTEDLGLEAGIIAVTLGAFLVSMGVCQLFYGPLADRFGRRVPLLTGCSIFVLGSLGCVVAPSLEWLSVARLVQGLGGAAGVVIARATVRDLFAEQEAARIFSQLMLVMGIAPVLAPWLGGMVLSHGSWRGIFMVLAAFGGACGLMAALRLPETLPVARRVKGGVGTALANYGALLRNGEFIAYASSGGFASGVLFSYIAGSPFVFMELHGISKEHYGMLFGLNAFGLILATQVNRLMLRRWTSHSILNGAAMLKALMALGLLGVVVSGVGGFVPLFVLLFGALFCVGLIFPNFAAVALGPHGEHAGSASALMGALQFLMAASAGAAVGYFNNGTALSMAVVMVFCAISGVLVLLPGIMSSRAN